MAVRRRPTDQLIELGSSIEHLSPAEIAELEAEARVLGASGLLDGFGGVIDVRTCDEPCALAVHGPAWLGTDDAPHIFVLGVHGAG